MPWSRQHWVGVGASNEGYPKNPEDFTITEKAPTRAFSWLKVATSVFTFKTLLRLRHYAKQVFFHGKYIDVKFGCRRKGHKGRVGWLVS